MTADAQSTKKLNVAHRGASGYRPEHTLASYRLAIEMGADFVEQDLAVTKDNVLICLHDPTLERTTNVEEVFPDRSTMVTWEGKTARSWLANDFTLAEIKQLDAGSWFDPKYKDEKVPTFDEAVALIKGKSGLFPELKTPEVYAGRPVQFEALVEAALDKHGLRGPKADPKSPIILQTFSESSAKKLAAMKIGVPVVLLIGSSKGVGNRRRREGVEALRAVARAVEGHHRRQPRSREVGARRGHDRHPVHLPRHHARQVPGRHRGDDAVPLHVRRGRTVHGQPG